jgi:maleate isomerase
MEPEFWRLIPQGVSIHTTRIRLERVNVEELLSMEKSAEEASRLLATADVDIIVYGCTTGSLVGGLGYDKKIARIIESASKRPAVTTATAVIEALKKLKAKNIALATPYIDEVNEKEVEFLEKHGFNVVDLKTFRIEKNTEIGKVPPERVYRLVRSLDLTHAEAVFISCTNLRTIEVIDPLERDLGLPVISSNTATAWLTLRKLGISEAGLKVGTLLAEYL